MATLKDLFKTTKNGICEIPLTTHKSAWVFFEMLNENGEHTNKISECEHILAEYLDCNDSCVTLPLAYHLNTCVEDITYSNILWLVQHMNA